MDDPAAVTRAAISGRLSGDADEGTTCREPWGARALSSPPRRGPCRAAPLPADSSIKGRSDNGEVVRLQGEEPIPERCRDAVRRR